MRSIESYLADLRGVDIYWLDQLAKGRLAGSARVLDVGCGGGRNIAWLLARGFEVHGLDRRPEAVRSVQRLAVELGLSGERSKDRFRVGEGAALPWPDATFDCVLSCAVLHFARGPDDFDRQVRELWRVLRPGGLFFARLASEIGIEDLVRPLGDRRFLLPDGSERWLVDEATLAEYQRQWRAVALEPIKTTVVQGQRAMTTWVLQRPS